MSEGAHTKLESYWMDIEDFGDFGDTIISYIEHQARLY